MAPIKNVLMILLIVATGCGSNERKSTQTRGSSYSEVKMSDDFSALPAALRYPNAQEVGLSSDSEETSVGTQFIMRTSDSFPAVVNFYKQAFSPLHRNSIDSIYKGFGYSGSDEFVTFTAVNEKGNDRLECLVIREPNGALIIIIKYRELGKQRSV